MPSAERTTTEPRAVGAVLLFLALLVATAGVGVAGFYMALGAALCERPPCPEPWEGDLLFGVAVVLFGATIWALVVAVRQVTTPLRGRAG